MPASTPGTAPTEIKASRSDWKYAVNSTKITNTATTSPMVSDANISFIGGSWPMGSTRTPRGGSPTASSACWTWPEARPMSSPSTLAVKSTYRCDMSRSTSPGRTPRRTVATSRIIRLTSGLTVCTGRVSTSSGFSIRRGGTWSCTR